MPILQTRIQARHEDFLHLVERAGANLLRCKVQGFVHGGTIFRKLARLSAAGLPVVTVVHGWSTAGGSYMPGLSDYVIMVRGRARAFLAGPPLLKAATGEIATEEELGRAEQQPCHRVAAGDVVRQGDTLLLLEAMTIEHPSLAPMDAVLAAVRFAQGAQVRSGALVVELSPASAPQTGARA